MDAKYGVEGEFYYNPDSTEMGQENDDNIIDYNEPPRTQPSLWLQWIILEDRQTIEWDGNEKFYEYVGWIQYLINSILAKEGYKVNGVVEWGGEERSDTGTITIVDNKIKLT